MLSVQARMKFVIAGQRTSDPRFFLSYTRFVILDAVNHLISLSEGNHEPLRLAAFDCLLLVRPLGRSSQLTTYLLEIVKNDSSLIVRRHVARGLSESIIFSLAVGDISGATLQPSIVDVNVNAEAEQSEQSKEQQREAQNVVMVKAMRKEFGKKLDARSALQGAFL